MRTHYLDMVKRSSEKYTLNAQLPSYRISRDCNIPDHFSRSFWKITRLQKHSYKLPLPSSMDSHPRSLQSDR